MYFRDRLQADAGENSIMQTISIAVSAILIAAGLITAPSLINNARDVNARSDLANLAMAQEYALANDGQYYAKVLKGDGDDSLWYKARGSGVSAAADRPAGSVAYTLSGTTTGQKALTCKDADGDWHYLMRAVSGSGKVWMRSSDSTRSSTKVSDLTVADCITAQDGLDGFEAGQNDPLAFGTDGNLGTTLLAARYAKTIAVENAPASDPATISVKSGTVPNGLAVEDDGEITGKPTKVGTFTFRLLAANVKSAPAEQDFTMKVSDSDVANWGAAAVQPPTKHPWSDVAVSPDGNTIVLGSDADGFTAATFDGGTTWNPGTIGDNAACGTYYTGNIMVAASNNSFAYTCSSASGMFPINVSNWSYGSVTGTSTASLNTTGSTAVKQSTWNSIHYGVDGYLYATDTKNRAYKYTIPSGWGNTQMEGQQQSYDATGMTAIATLSNGGVVLTGSGKGGLNVYIGGSFTPTYTPDFNGSKVVSISVSNNGGAWVGSTYVSPKWAYAATEDGSIWQTQDAGATWSQIKPAGDNVRWKHVVTYDGVTLAAASTDGKYMVSTDSGVTWTSNQPNVNIPITDVAINAAGTKTVAVGSNADGDATVYVGTIK